MCPCMEDRGSAALRGRGPGDGRVSCACGWLYVTTGSSAEAGGRGEATWRQKQRRERCAASRASQAAPERERSQEQLLPLSHQHLTGLRRLPEAWRRVICAEGGAAAEAQGAHSGPGEMPAGSPVLGPQALALTVCGEGAPSAQPPSPQPPGPPASSPPWRPPELALSPAVKQSRWELRGAEGCTHGLHLHRRRHLPGLFL